MKLQSISTTKRQWLSNGYPQTSTLSCALRCQAFSRKGFGDVAINNDERQRKAPKGKRVNIKREEAPIPNQGRLGLETSFKAVEKIEEGLQAQREDQDFQKRLTALKAEGALRRKDGQVVDAKPAENTAIFDTNIDYANPPSLGDTLLSQLNSDVSDPKLKTAQFGPNQVAVAGSALLLVLMYIVVSGGDFATSKRYKGVRPLLDAPDGIEAAMIKGRIAQLSNALEADPSNVEALEEEAVSYAQLFEFEKAAGLLDKLVAMRPRDGEAWRLLGETTLLSQQPARSTIAYEKAAALIPDDLQVLTGLADAYIANGQPGKAVDYLLALKTKRIASQQEQSKPLNSGISSEVGVIKEDVEVAAMTGPSSSEVKSSIPTAGTQEATPLATASASSVDTAAIDLLIGKVYGSWRGHDNDALATYDALIKSSPEDFRAYLAKGLFLKEHGRKADAERMFIQAKFYAPASRQAFIKQLSESNPVLDLPGDE
ncbi:hypothetical protein CEUSTIGMA_g1752.t1 [Chlamydomonas eustigma]|uniref:Tetratricopeptide repeat-like domain-containing protein n=1 Tax=Chlamydomonas eustigma TaxID=1157962 RepID=A0A250WU05_9CHLO|nr:hypothetical protein CEUSTIGMA_g1752.t1 [Chlamydomonas eustigma]|eukprot:GAX74303.1 hypothetical protein CEUSTIGMA_g1752.t1 [Chlamydomonas eustigma]